MSEQIEIKQYKKYLGIFSPKRMDDLKPDTLRFIGTTSIWQASWIIEDGQFEGQMAMGWTQSDEVDRPTDWIWVPDSDLEILCESNDEVKSNA